MSTAIIFDLDGTLWDSTQQACIVWNQFFQTETDYDLEITEEMFESLMGLVQEEIGARIFPQLSKEEQIHMMYRIGLAEVDYLEVHGANVYDGTRQTLEKLSQTNPLFMVSNCQDGYLNAFLHYHGVEQYITDYEMSGRTGLKKADNIKLIMERNHLNDAVYVGDTTGDESAAREAGIPFIHATYGFGTANAPDAVIHDITELPDCSLIQD